MCVANHCYRVLVKRVAVQIRVEDLILKELQKATSKLSLLPESGMTFALEKFVQKSEVHAIEGLAVVEHVSTDCVFLKQVSLAAALDFIQEQLTYVRQAALRNPASSSKEVIGFVQELVSTHCVAHHMLLLSGTLSVMIRQAYHGPHLCFFIAHPHFHTHAFSITLTISSLCRCCVFFFSQ